MPWQEVVTVELRQQFVHDALHWVVPVTELCSVHGISRKTGYKFLARYHALGSAGLADQLRRPHRSPTALDPVLLQRLLEAFTFGNGTLRASQKRATRSRGTAVVKRNGS
jgi:hypothetical protein